MKIIGIASDHAGFELKQYVKKWLEAKGWECTPVGSSRRKRRMLSGNRYLRKRRRYRNDLEQTPRHTCSPLLDAGNSTHVEVTQ